MKKNTKKSTKNTPVTPVPAVPSVPVTMEDFVPATPVPAVVPVPAVPSVPELPFVPTQIGVPNLKSRRIDPTVVGDTWRIARNQRKEVFAGKDVTHYVQFGVYRMDPATRVSRFAVQIEIPFSDQWSAKVELARRVAEMNASKIA